MYILHIYSQNLYTRVNLSDMKGGGICHSIKGGCLTRTASLVFEFRDDSPTQNALSAGSPAT